MNTIQNLFQQAQLAEAAYADFIGNTNPINALTTGDGKFSQAQATDFVTHWRVIDQYTAPAGMFGLTDGTGFSATVFESLDHPGQYTFAARGTQPGYADLAADLGDIVSDGLALDQIVDMYNYWQSLHHDLGYTAYKLETQLVETAKLTTLWAQVAIPGASIYAKDVYDAYRAELQNADLIIDVGPLGPSVRKLISGDSVVLLTGTPLAIGSGKLIAVNTVDASGHSLGGHLAMAFSRLFPSATSEVVAVNGAGFDLNNGNVNTLLNQLGGGAGFDAGKITNVVGSAAMNLVSQDWLFLQQPAGRKEIYTEDGSLLGSNVAGHGAGQMTDSLALYNLLATLDPSLNQATQDNLDKITGFLKASSYEAANSLEYTLDALRTLLQTAYTTRSPNIPAQPATLIDNRESLYANLKSLQDYLANSPFNTADSYSPQYVFTLRTLKESAGSSSLEKVARTDLATRYALYQGNTFVLDDTGFDLYTTINSKGDLDLYDAAAHTGNLTDQYLVDRAAFVLAKEKANTDDTQIGVGLSTNAGWAKMDGEQVYYLDKIGSGLPDYASARIFQGGSFYGGIDDIKQIQFGSLLGDTLTGGNKADDLYGMGGDDTLTGGKGNDYLEGGKGTDTYKYTTGDGLDTVLDTDGKGSVQIDSQVVSGGAQFGDARVHRDADGHLYTQVDRGLIIDGNIFVQDWQAGNLGIDMAGPQAQDNPVTTLTLTGDLTLIDIAPGTPGLQVNLDELGNAVADAGVPAPGYVDLLMDSAGNDHITSGGGADTINATQGGDDFIEAGDGANTVNSGAGNDVIFGEGGDDILKGNSGNDVLLGGDGKDTLYGEFADGSVLSINGEAANDIHYAIQLEREAA